MSPSFPTLAELRSTAQKGRHREIGNWLARRVARPSAVYGTWLAVRLGLSAHQVTLAALAASLGGALAIGAGSRLGFVLGVSLLHLGFWLDHVDGQVARWRGTVEPRRSLLRLPDAPSCQHGVGLCSGLWDVHPDRQPGLVSRRVRDRRGLDVSQPSERLPLQGLLPAPQEHFGDLLASRAEAAASPSLRPPGPGEAWAF